MTSYYPEPSESQSERTPISYARGALHPCMVENYLPKKKLKIPKKNDEMHYGSLTDKSPFAEYAWEFLRRNRFYQSIIDNASPSFNIEDWGYAPAPCYGYSFGLFEEKDYTQKYAVNEPKWMPLFDISSQVNDSLMSIMSTLKSRPLEIDFPGFQVPFLFHIAPIFGPGSYGLQEQADLAISLIEKHMAELKQKKKENDHQVKGLINRPGKDKLRMLLRVADLLTYRQKIDSDQTGPSTETLPIPSRVTATEASKMLDDYNFLYDAKEIPKTPALLAEATLRYVEKARGMIYGWQCLSLLTFSNQGRSQCRELKLK